MTIKEALERAKQFPSYSENFTEEGERSLKTITTGLQVTFIPHLNTLSDSTEPTEKASGQEDNSKEPPKDN
jgi:hypothetical protein